MIVVGDGGPGGVQASATKLGSGMDAGSIAGTHQALLCSAMSDCFAKMAKGKLFSGGETGEVFMHNGAPFEGQGKVIEKF